MAHTTLYDGLADLIREALRTRPQWRIIKALLSGVYLEHANLFSLTVWIKDGNLHFFPVQCPYVQPEVYEARIPLEDPECMTTLGQWLDTLIGLWLSRK